MKCYYKTTLVSSADAIFNSYVFINTDILINICNYVDPDPPMITSLPPSPIQETVVGDPLVIDCIATTPVAVDVNLLNFTWISPGGDMITNDSRITIHSTIAIANMYVRSLQFNHLIISDGGTYMCNVRFFDVIGSLSVVMDPPDCECVYIT